MYLYHCIIPNNKILLLQFVRRRGQTKKENKSSNKAITIYTKICAEISEGD